MVTGIGTVESNNVSTLHLVQSSLLVPQNLPCLGLLVGGWHPCIIPIPRSTGWEGVGVHAGPHNLVWRPSGTCNWLAPLGHVSNPHLPCITRGVGRGIRHPGSCAGPLPGVETSAWHSGVVAQNIHLS